MDLHRVSAAIKQLKHSEGARSDTARLRDIFDAIESALNSGVRQKVILRELNNQGFNMKMEGFKSALKRIRKERKDSSNHPTRESVSTARDANQQFVAWSSVQTPPSIRHVVSASEVSHEAIHETKTEAVIEILESQSAVGEGKFAKYGKSLTKPLVKKKES
jgi:hypothetical protein